MPKSNIVVISAVALIASVGMASAQQKKTKISREEAWSRCTEEVVKSVPSDQHSQRYARGAACMKKFGYKI
jgi:hypothetical protein